MVRAQSSGSLSQTRPHRPDVAGVVDQNVNCPVVSQGLGDGLLHLLTAGHVRDDGNCVAAKPPGNQIRRLL